MGRHRFPYPVPEAHLREELRTTIDRLVAAKYSVSPALVAQWRYRLGIAVTAGQPRRSDRRPLRQQIVDCLNATPQGLRQVDLARLLGVSRQAIQQALKSLQTHGVVTVHAVPGETTRRPYWAYEQRWVAVQSTLATEGESTRKRQRHHQGHRELRQ